MSPVKHSASCLYCQLVVTSTDHPTGIEFGEQDDAVVATQLCGHLLADFLDLIHLSWQAHAAII